MSDTSNTNTCHISEKSGNVITPAGVIFYAQYVVKGGKDNKGNEKYNLELCLPPEADLKGLKNAMGKLALENLDGDADQAKNYVNKRFLDPNNKPDGGKPAGDKFKGWTLIRASSKTPPDFVWPNGKKMSTQEALNSINSGDYVRATVNPYWLDTKTDDGVRIKGLFLGLQNIQLVKKGEAIGFVKPEGEEEFGAIDGAEDFTSSDSTESKSSSGADALFG